MREEEGRTPSHKAHCPPEGYKRPPVAFRTWRREQQVQVDDGKTNKTESFPKITQILLVRLDSKASPCTAGPTG